MTNVSNVLEGVRGAIEAENADMVQQGGGSKFTVRPLPQPGPECLARFLLHHNYTNGLNISGTEVALVFGSQVVAKHPRLALQLEDDNWREADESSERLVNGFFGHSCGPASRDPINILANNFGKKIDQRLRCMRGHRRDCNVPSDNLEN